MIISSLMFPSIVEKYPLPGSAAPIALADMLELLLDFAR
tara:strand:+ start:1591 stop:1707 length:117 start_codon:yes stop_codon:yes gene_type:complete